MGSVALIDIRKFMKKLNYEWSDTVGCYYHRGLVNSVIDPITAGLLYEKIMIKNQLG